MDFITSKTCIIADVYEENKRGNRDLVDVVIAINSFYQQYG